jgi:hypothetical protein
MKSRHLSSRRLMAWSLLGFGLSIAPGCGLSSGLHREPDHVYSDTTPPMIQQQPGVQPLPARAYYPDENTTMSATDSGVQPDGVVRLGGQQQPRRLVNQAKPPSPTRNQPPLNRHRSTANSFWPAISLTM